MVLQNLGLHLVSELQRGLLGRLGAITNECREIRNSINPGRNDRSVWMMEGNHTQVKLGGSENAPVKRKTSKPLSSPSSNLITGIRPDGLEEGLGGRTGGTLLGNGMVGQRVMDFRFHSSLHSLWKPSPDKMQAMVMKAVVAYAQKMKDCSCRNSGGWMKDGRRTGSLKCA
jgi:hypothetical protein